MFSVNVEHLGGEAASFREAEDPFCADGVDKDADGGDFELAPVESTEGVGDSGDEVGATADGFSDENIGAGSGGEIIGGIDEGVKPATEAPPGDFLRGETLGAEHGGIDEVHALVIRDEADAFALGGERLGEFGDCGGFAGAEESSDHDVAGFGGRDGGGVRRGRHGGRGG